MPRLRTTTLAALVGVTLSACTENAPTVSRGQITADPIMTKYDSQAGGGGCPGGGRQTSAGGAGECLPEYDPQYPPRVPGQPRSGSGGNPGGGQQGGGRT